MFDTIMPEARRLLKQAEEMAETNKAMTEHGRGDPMVDHIVDLTKLIHQIAQKQRAGF